MEQLQLCLIMWVMRLQHTEPRRGDIIIFKFPDDESEKYVKRIIGLPGEKVTIKEAKVYINDSEVPLEEDYLKEDWVTLFPALFMTAVCSTYIVMAPVGFGLSAWVGYPVGAVAVLLSAGLFFRWRALSMLPQRSEGTGS